MDFTSLNSYNTNITKNFKLFKLFIKKYKKLFDIAFKRSNVSFIPST